MNAYLFSSIQSAAYGNLFECSTHEENGRDIVFSSMSHENEVAVMDDGEELLLTSLLNTEGLKTKFPSLATEDGIVVRHPKNDLTNHLALLGELFHASATLLPDPNAVLPERTVRIATVRARLGQHRYKVSQAEMWGNACAVTGITEPALLRASHAKPWADATDSERLDPANGLPLAVHLDALFDVGLISFDSDGSMMISPKLEPEAIALYGLSEKMRLRNAPTAKQEKYLQYHRRNVFQLSKAREVLEYIDSLGNIPCERYIADVVNDQFCEPPRVNVDEEDNRIDFSPAEFNEIEFEAAIDTCDELFGSNGAIWWEASVLGTKLQKVDARGDWNVVEPGILEKVPSELEPDDGGSRDVEYFGEITSSTRRAVELLFEEIMEGETSSALDLRDIRSHEDDVEETLSQLDDLGFDAFYELGGEYYGWHKESPPPYEDFSESDLITTEALAEELVSSYE